MVMLCLFVVCWTKNWFTLFWSILLCSLIVCSNSCVFLCEADSVLSIFLQRASCLGRRAAVNPETLSFLDTDSVFVTSRPEAELFGSRYYRHVRHPSPDGLGDSLRCVHIAQVFYVLPAGVTVLYSLSAVLLVTPLSSLYQRLRKFLMLDSVP